MNKNVLELKKSLLITNKKTNRKPLSQKVVAMFFSLFLLFGTVSPALAVEGTSPLSLGQKLNEESLSTGSIVLHETPNSRGTVIYLPQIHITPGTNAADSANDSAERAQNEMYGIISSLSDKGIGFVMVEGEMYGSVSGEKIGRVTEKLVYRNAFSDSTQKLNQALSVSNVDPALKGRITTETSRTIETADREIILAGAPYKLKAEGKPLTLYGSENPATYEESANYVRSYIYLKDREAALSGSARGNGANTTVNNAAAILSSLGKTSEPRASLGTDLDSLGSMARQTNQNELATAAENTRLALENLIQVDQKPAASGNTASRQNNPYAHITDLATLRGMIADVEKNIQSTVIERRNVETAENFARGLEASGQNVGILQFGAGHEEGLVKELLNQGLSVLVVTATEVAGRNISTAGESGAKATTPGLTPAQQQLLEKIKQARGGQAAGDTSLVDRDAMLRSLILKKLAERNS